MQKQGRLPCIDPNGIPRGGASRSRCMFAGHHHWNSLVDSDAVLSPVPWRLCNRFVCVCVCVCVCVFPFVSCAILIDPRPLRFRFSLTAPPAVAFRGAPSGHVPNSATRSIRLQARTPCSQSSVAAGGSVGAAAVVPQAWGGVVASGITPWLPSGRWAAGSSGTVAKGDR